MLFYRTIYEGTEREYAELWTLDKPPPDDDIFMLVNGAPVELCITDELGHVLATHEEIGWFDEGEHTEDLRDVTIKDLNIILKNHKGMLDIDMNDSTPPVPDFQEEKVVIRFKQY